MWWETVEAKREDGVPTKGYGSDDSDSPSTDSMTKNDLATALKR